MDPGSKDAVSKEVEKRQRQKELSDAEQMLVLAGEEGEDNEVQHRKAAAFLLEGLQKMGVTTAVLDGDRIVFGALRMDQKGELASANRRDLREFLLLSLRADTRTTVDKTIIDRIGQALQFNHDGELTLPVRWARYFVRSDGDAQKSELDSLGVTLADVLKNPGNSLFAHRSGYMFPAVKVAGISGAEFKKEELDEYVQPLSKLGFKDIKIREENDRIVFHLPQPKDGRYGASVSRKVARVLQRIFESGLAVEKGRGFFLEEGETGGIVLVPPTKTVNPLLRQLQSDAVVRTVGDILKDIPAFVQQWEEMFDTKSLRFTAPKGREKK